MEEIKLNKEQEILFEVYDKGVQNEDCDLDAYVEKIKQALSIAIVRRSVFLVVHHDAYQYGDRHVEGVFDSKDKAEDYIFKKGSADWEIDEHEINPNYA